MPNKPAASGDVDRPEIDTTDLLAMLAQRFPGGSLSYVPAPADPADAWKIRAEAFRTSREMYKGPVHWQRCLEILAATGSPTFACHQSGVSRVKFNSRRERYECFAERVLEAIAYFKEAVLERAATQRAVDGVLKQVFHKGAIVGHEIVYSDSLLTTLLQGNLQDKYKNRVAVEGGNELKVTITGGLPTKKTEEEVYLEEQAAAEAAAASAPKA